MDDLDSRKIAQIEFDNRMLEHVSGHRRNCEVRDCVYCNTYAEQLAARVWDETITLPHRSA